MATLALHKLMMAWLVPVEGLCMGGTRDTLESFSIQMPSVGYKLDGLCPMRDLVGPTHKHCSPLLQCVCAVWQTRISSNTDIYVVVNCASLLSTYLLQHKSLMCARAQKLNVCGSDLRFFTSHVRGPHHCTAICRANNVLSNDLLEPLD